MSATPEQPAPVRVQPDNHAEVAGLVNAVYPFGYPASFDQDGRLHIWDGDELVGVAAEGDWLVPTPDGGLVVRSEPPR